MESHIFIFIIIGYNSRTRVSWTGQLIAEAASTWRVGWKSCDHCGQTRVCRPDFGERNGHAFTKSDEATWFGQGGKESDLNDPLWWDRVGPALYHGMRGAPLGWDSRRWLRVRLMCCGQDSMGTHGHMPTSERNGGGWRTRWVDHQGTLKSVTSSGCGVSSRTWLEAWPNLSPCRKFGTTWRCDLACWPGHTVKKLRSLNLLFSRVLCIERKTVHDGAEKIVTLY